ncbi:MAG TPA: 2-amino-4-hydroxy-6-hydroxymethyldihydropteridine diphosphokinase [Candidatus Binatia bacterium]|jgi:2-amino-4-hydroxy-6-hydroxymethyldihydropteridine diphosphokinase|nr:2-amino-4-hydroxy-6-hydroxymethyldihydropteridine diphosphokinase [Candidatus Binatia bacterium]
MTRACLGLGSNLGDRLAHLRLAVTGLEDVLQAVSGVYETPPWGDPDQPTYLNAVVIVEDPAAGPRDWLRRAQALERTAERVRDPVRRYGPRTLDVDVILVWRNGEPVVEAAPDLTLPHPAAHERAFVLVPLAEIVPDAAVPGHGMVRDLLEAPRLAADRAAVRRVADADLTAP